MTKHVEKLNKEIMLFIKDNVVDSHMIFFDSSHKVKQDKIKQLLLERYALCRNAGDPDDQRKKVTQFFMEIDDYLSQEHNESVAAPSSSSSSSSEDEQTAVVCEFWSLMGLALLNELKQNPEIHQGGFLRGRSATGHDESSLFLAILHRQLFGVDLAMAGKAYPTMWSEWVTFMQIHLEILSESIQQGISPLQRQLWSNVFKSVLQSIDTKDTQRSEKFVYQLFFNVINPFKSLVHTAEGFKPFTIPLTILKANPEARTGRYDDAILATLYDLLKVLLFPVRREFTLPPATATMIAELKLKLGHGVAAGDAKGGRHHADVTQWQACLKGSRLVAAYGSINTKLDNGGTAVTDCRGALYANVPKAMQLEGKSAANDDCCACLIL